MSVLEAITTKAAQLPLKLQQEALKQIELLAQRSEQVKESDGEEEKTVETLNGVITTQSRQTQSNVESLAHLGGHVTEEDIADARRTMFSGVNRASTSQVRTKQIEQPVRNVLGMFEHLNIKITEQDIAEARREMWGNFPREEPR